MPRQTKRPVFGRPTVEQMTGTRPDSGQTTGQTGLTVHVEQDSVRELVRLAVGAEEISVDIPQDATLAQAEAALSTVIRGYNAITDAGERLKPAIGRILLTIEERKLFKPMYKTFTGFIADRVVGTMGFSRSTAFDALKIARAFPTMSTDEYARYGATRLLFASRVTNHKAADYRQILDAWSRVSVDQVKKEVKLLKPAASPDAKQFIIALRVGQDVWNTWRSMLDASQLAPADLLQTLMANCPRKVLKPKARPAEAPQGQSTGAAA